MGVYLLDWTPAISLEVIGTPGPDFGSKSLLALNSKNLHFSHKPHNMGVYGLTRTPATKISHFELTWNPKDTEDVQWSLRHCDSADSASALKSPL